MPAAMASQEIGESKEEKQEEQADEDNKLDDQLNDEQEIKEDDINNMGK